MNPWFVNPAWQNFSSMYRETVAASGSNSGMERAHHMTAALYFGIAALEAFINDQRKAHPGQLTETAIRKSLRYTELMEKLRNWPMQILGKPLAIGSDAVAMIEGFNRLRGSLTHPKDQGHEVYGDLEAIDPSVVVHTVAEYIVRYHEAAGTTYPYWVLGWNYLNPRPASYEIMIINDQQFMFSLQALGFSVNAARPSDAARLRLLGSFEGYIEVRDGLSKQQRCQPKHARFPHAPILCRHWWTPEHQKTCGCVTKDAVQIAMDIDNAYGSKMHPVGGPKG